MAPLRRVSEKSSTTEIILSETQKKWLCKALDDEDRGGTSLLDETTTPETPRSENNLVSYAIKSHMTVHFIQGKIRKNSREKKAGIAYVSASRLGKQFWVFFQLKKAIDQCKKINSFIG